MPSKRPLAAALLLSLIWAGTAQAQDGAQIFKARCQMCHAITPDGKAGAMAPNLRGVVGRKAGSGNFAGYSPALKAFGKVWTAPNLEGFLAAPGKLVPGTRMMIALPDPGERAAVIAYLAAQH